MSRAASRLILNKTKLSKSLDVASIEAFFARYEPICTFFGKNLGANKGHLATCDPGPCSTIKQSPYCPKNLRRCQHLTHVLPAVVSAFTAVTSTLVLTRYTRFWHTLTHRVEDQLHVGVGPQLFPGRSLEKDVAFQPRHELVFTAASAHNPSCLPKHVPVPSKSSPISTHAESPTPNCRSGLRCQPSNIYRFASIASIACATCAASPARNPFGRQRNGFGKLRRKEARSPACCS